MRLAGILALLFATQASALDVVVPPPPPGGRNAVACEKLTSILLAPTGETIKGWPAYKSVPKSAKVHTCPPLISSHLEIEREALRSYQLTLRLYIFDADGNIVQQRLLPPYFLWGGPAELTPKSPLFRLLAALW